MKNSIKITVLLVVFASVLSCKDDNKPNYQYMPNMYESVGYEAYGKYEVFPDGYEALEPVAGSVARGWLPYEYENTAQAKDSAKVNLKNPLLYTEDNLAKGGELYNIYCGVCHGDKGDGQGILAKREKVLGVPAYNDAGRAITEGSVYHVMYYGINSMGSYASQMTEEELWLVDHYVMTLKAKLNGEPQRAFYSEHHMEVEDTMHSEHDEDVAVEEIVEPVSEHTDVTGSEH